ncbi:hypothetical protein WME79_36590 [Sorangium sp. So ce726]
MQRPDAPETSIEQVVAICSSAPGGPGAVAAFSWGRDVLEEAGG